MDRPLWQLLLMIFAIGFVLRQAAFVFAFEGAEGGVSVPLAAGYGLQLVAGLLAGLFVAIEHRLVLLALVVLGAAVAATLGLEAVSPDGLARFEATSGALALAVTVALYVFLRRAFRGDPA